MASVLKTKENKESSGEDSGSVSSADSGDDMADTTIPIYETLYSFAGEEQTDLSFKPGELLMILKKRDDGWWEAENEFGQTGWVPSTYLRKVTDYSSDDPESSSEDNDDDDYVPETAAVVSEQAEAVQVHDFSNTGDASRAARAEASQFYNASLASILKEDPRFHISYYASPQLDSSALSVKELKWNTDTNTLMPMHVTNQRILTLKVCQRVPVPSEEFEIQSRHIRLCLHSGTQILSNIYTVRSKWDSKFPKYWSFKEKVKAGDSLVKDAKLFIRSNSYHSTIGVLFQLCYIYKRMNSDETEEVSCGWAFLPLLNAAGMPISNGIKILNVHEGDPCKDLKSEGMDSTMLMAQGKQMSSARNTKKRQQPRLSVRISTPSQKLAKQLDLLPETLVGPVSILPVVLMYRRCLASELNNGNAPHTLAGVRQSPVLTAFPKLLDQPDILDAFKLSWKKLAKSLKKEAKKDPAVHEKAFSSLFIETAYVMLHLNSMPLYEFGNRASEELRSKEIRRLMDLHKSKGPHSLLILDEEHEPFSTDEIYFDITRY